MKINTYLRIIQLASGIAAILDKSYPQGLPRGDAGLYLGCRILIDKLEESNPGIAESLGLSPL